ncbi:hypothetical protein IAU60_002525 [Kwoniella sp. DSM 27419]
MSSPAASSVASGGSSRANTPDEQVVALYQDIMSGLFPASSLPPPPAPLLEVSTERSQTAVQDSDDEEGNTVDGMKRPMTKAEKQNAKKKRRKERERAERLVAEAEAQAQAQARAAPGSDGRVNAAAEPVAIVDFRLFSSCPLQPISISPQQDDYAIPPNPRHTPRDPAQVTQIRFYAQQAAVTYEDLHAYASAGPSRSHRRDKVPPEMLAMGQTTLPGMFVGELGRERRVRVAPGSTQVPKRKSPTARSVHIIPLEQPLTDETKRAAHGKTRPRTRRGKRKPAASRHEPVRFYAPAAGLGGKVRGYAWGYRDSMEGRREPGSWQGYVRSKDR